MPAKIVKDPTHPDFPHGQPRGYQRGCKNPTTCPATVSCKVARRLQLRANAKARILGGGPVRIAPPAHQEAARKHVRRLLKHSESGNRHLIGKVAGVDFSQVVAVLDGHPVRPATIRRLLALSLARLDAAAHAVPADRTRWHLNTMRALGYPLGWQEAQTGRYLKKLVVTARQDQPTVHADLAAEVAALAARVGDTHATPAATGLTPSAIALAKRAARRTGHYPPACYDDEGVLDLRAVPGGPFQVADDAAYGCLDVIRALCDGGSYLETARAAGIELSRVERYAKASGLRRVSVDFPARRCAALDLLDQVQAGAVDVVAAAVALGVKNMAGVPHAHPARIAHQAELDARTDAAHRYVTAHHAPTVHDLLVAA